jgi:hypothetical protein
MASAANQRIGRKYPTDTNPCQLAANNVCGSDTDNRNNVTYHLI